MKIFHANKRTRAVTRMEVTIVLAVLAILVVIAFSGIIHQRDRTLGIQCHFNLRDVGDAFRFWANDHNDQFPMSCSQTNDGSKEFITGMNAFHHFQAVSNQLTTLAVLLCPADLYFNRAGNSRVTAANFASLGNANLSFFVGIEADKNNSASILSGDRNITNALPLDNGMLEAAATAATRWTTSLHNRKGNILFADGSVRLVEAADLPAVMTKTGLATNFLQMPVTFP